MAKQLEEQELKSIQDAQVSKWFLSHDQLVF